MESVNNIYLDKHKKFRLDSKKLATAFIISAFIVAIIVFWWLKLVGITVTGEAFCGIDEHTHGDECYISELICGFDETVSGTLPTETETPEESASAEDGKEVQEDDVTEETQTQTEITVEAHTHSDDCYSKKLSCKTPEHTHTQDCFPDKTADTETVSDWLGTIENIEITNNIPENLIAVAMSQVGYEESANNFEFDLDGNRNGYTRYGEWYGNPYGKWNVMFVSFCLHYSNINNSDELKAAGAEAMRLAWEKRNIYSSVQEYTPQRGDIVFTDTDGDKVTDTVGVVLSADSKSLVVIMGDSNNRVKTENIENSDNVIGYGLTSELSFAEDKEYEKETEESTNKKEEATERPPVLMMAAPLDADSTHDIIYINDLTSVVKAVQFKTTEGEVIDENSTIYIGQTYVVLMEFAEKNTGSPWIQFQHDDHHELHYQIPENIHCEEFEDWHPITAKTENGTIENVGRYFIYADGRLVVVFDDDETGVCFGAKYSNVDFTIEFNATVGSTGAGTTTEVVFNDKVTVNFAIDGGAGIDMSKTHGEYDADNHTMEYTVRVEATHGLVKDFTLEDYTWNTHQILRDTVVVTDLDGNPVDPQPTIADAITGGIYSGCRLVGFPDFSAGEGYLITYKTKVDDNLISNDTVSLSNGAYGAGKDSNGTTVDSYKEDWVVVELEKMTKDGKQTVLKDASGNDVPVIEWEVAIKKNNSNLQGTVVIDTLGEGLQYYTEQPILIKHYDEWGYPLADQHLSWDNVTINGNSMSFPLPDGYMFDIFYYTTYELPEEGEQHQYNNSVSATINGKYETAGGEADVVGFIPHVKKNAYGNDGKYAYFTIEADVPGAIKNWGNFYLTDNAAFWEYGNNEAGYLYIENIPEYMVITAVTKSGRTINFTPHVAGGPVENTYILVAPADDMRHTFKIYFNTSETTNDSSKWLLDEDAVLTVTYKIPFDAKTGTEWTGELSGNKTLEDVLLENYSLANQVTLNYTNVIKTEHSASYKYSPKISKKSVANEDGTIDYTVVFFSTIPGTNGNGGYLASADIAYFTDTFDERLEYVPNSLTVTCYDPWNSNNWLNRYRYNGTVSGNSMEIASTEFKFDSCNPNCGWDNPWLSTLDTYYTYCRNMGGGQHIFTYKLKVKDEYLYTTEHSKYEFDNTAEVKWDKDGSSGPVTERTEFETGLIDKSAVQEDNRLDFDIHINRYSLDILKGVDDLVIEDTMTPNLSVYWESIKLYYEEDGNWIDFDSTNKYNYSVTYDQDSNKLTFVIPDELHIRIDYSTLITESGLVSVNNSVSINASAQVTDIIDATFHVQEHSGDASGSMHSITLLKQDGDTDMPLPDVRFLLYGPVGDQNATLPTGVNRYMETEDGKQLGYIGSYTTGDDGTVEIETQYLTVDGPYALVETSPPEGYMKLEKPVYFYFYEPDPDGIIQTVTTIIAVENYTYGFVLPETGGMGTLPITIIGFALTAFPLLYSTIRRKRERRLR